MIQLQALNKAILDNDITLLTQNGLDVEYLDEYSEEYEFIIEHYKDYGNVPDDETILDRFEGFKLLDVKESQRYIVEKLQEEKMFNDMIPILNDISEQMQVDSFQAVKDGAPKLMKLMQEKVLFGAVDIAANAGKRYDWAASIAEKNGMLGLRTGFKHLDDLLGGLLPGEELVVITARPGVGKSWLMDAIAANVWNQGHSILLYSGEMSEELVGSRIDTIISQVPNSGITRGTLTESEWDSYDEHITYMENSGVPLMVSTPEHLGDMLNINTLEALIEKYKPEAVFIDQLSLMREDYPTRRQTREIYADITKQLFNMSAKHGIPILLNVQTSRQATQTISQTPRLENLAESDGIGQNASRVIGMTVDWNSGTPIMSAALIKNRYGVSNQLIEILWDVNNGLIKDIGVRSLDGDDDEESGERTVSRAFTPKNSSDGRENVPRDGIEAF